MRITDCHVHVRGEADPACILRQMDANGVHRVIVISRSERVSLQDTRANLLQTKRALDAAPDRIGGLAWVNPTIPGMSGLAEEALTEMGYVGIKIIPDHWYAYEERLEPFWEAMNRLRARILFHTGILYAYDDSSRFCQPVWLEKLVNYPNVRFAMAHIAWPWCEECLAVMGRMRAAAEVGGWEWQSYVDITPGTPPHIRKQALGNAISFCGVERLLFGTDSFCGSGGLEYGVETELPGDLRSQKATIEADLRIFDELGLTEKQKERIMSGTANELFPSRP